MKTTADVDNAQFVGGEPAMHAPGKAGDRPLDVIRG